MEGRSGTHSSGSFAARIIGLLPCLEAARYGAKPSLIVVPIHRNRKPHNFMAGAMSVSRGHQ